MSVDRDSSIRLYHLLYQRLTEIREASIIAKPKDHKALLDCCGVIEDIIDQMLESIMDDRIEILKWQIQQIEADTSEGR